MLDFPAPKLLCYSRESCIAEKFEAMVKLGRLNSRMKDFYDIWLLSRQFNFDGAQLSEAIRLTFKQRGTTLPSKIDAFTESFIDAKQIEWTAFRKRLQQNYVPGAFGEIISALSGFLIPIVSFLSADSLMPTNWTPAGSWYLEEPAKPSKENFEMQNLDLECAKLAENLAQQTTEQMITKALGVLEEQGLYAYFLFLKSSGENEIVRQCQTFLEKIALLENGDSNIFIKLQNLSTDLDKLLLARDLLRQALVYARYHAKAKEKTT